MDSPTHRTQASMVSEQRRAYNALISELQSKISGKLLAQTSPCISVYPFMSYRVHWVHCGTWQTTCWKLFVSFRYLDLLVEDLLLLLVEDVLLLSVLEEAFVLLGSILFLKLLALLFQKHRRVTWSVQRQTQKVLTPKNLFWKEKQVCAQNITGNICRRLSSYKQFQPTQTVYSTVYDLWRSKCKIRLAQKILS